MIFHLGRAALAPRRTEVHDDPDVEWSTVPLEKTGRQSRA